MYVVIHILLLLCYLFFMCIHYLTLLSIIPVICPKAVEQVWERRGRQFSQLGRQSSERDSKGYKLNFNRFWILWCGLELAHHVLRFHFLFNFKSGIREWKFKILEAVKADFIKTCLNRFALYIIWSSIYFRFSISDLDSI